MPFFRSSSSDTPARDARSHSQRSTALDWAAPLAVLIVGVAISVVVFAVVRARERTLRRIDFERRLEDVSVSVRASFDSPLEVLESVPALFEASRDVSRLEFHDFVRDALERHPCIYALEWIPRVPAIERARFEAQAVIDGLAGYHFKQDSASGPPVPASARAEYLPLYYMEPPNPIALGLEETALPLRRVALERARDLGGTVMTPGLRLVQDDPTMLSVIAFHPVFDGRDKPGDVESRRKRLSGFAAAVFRLRPALAGVVSAAMRERFDVVLTDVDATPASVLYESRDGAGDAAASGLSREQVVTVGGRRWVVRLTDRVGWLRASEAGWLVLGVGGLVSALATAFALAFGAVIRLRKQVSAARRLGQYTLVEKLGEGGMGTVYRAHHALLRRPTAVKLLDPARSSPTAIARFESEVQLTSALTHPNTVTVYDYGHSPEGVFYYAMEYIDGITLQELVDIDGPQPAARVIPIIAQICEALSEAHCIGLVHRDVKPANVMLCNRGGVADFVKVLDFGLVKDLSASRDTELSQQVALIGTPLYVAPEVALRTSVVDARADLYAVGAVAYFLLVGGPVFSGATALEVCMKHVTEDPELPSVRLGKPMLAALEDLVMCCLAKDPAQRPESAAELARALRALPSESWTQADARTWWHERSEGFTERRRASRIVPTPPERTLEVDRARRTSWRSPRPVTPQRPPLSDSRS